MAKSLQEIQDMLTDKWSNNACRGYVIKAMESCGYKSKDIREILIELYEVFDFCSVEEAADYYEHWQPCPRANLARSVEKYERAALFTGCRLFAFPHRTKRKRATMSFCMKKAVLLIG